MHSGIKAALCRATMISVASVLFANAFADSGKQPAEKIDSLVTADWLSKHLDDPNLVILDCSVLVEMLEDGSFRTVNGKASYDRGHIPTAGFADLTGDLSDNASPHQFAVPQPEQFASAMGALGVGNDSRVVLYDSGNSAWAARVWWMLRWIGFDQAALLDGGLSAWIDLGLPLSSKPAERPASRLTVSLRPELLADREEVLASIGNDAVTLIDAMPAEHYNGEITIYDRPGHIPGALNMPASTLLNELGYFKQHDELASMIDTDRDARTITYCGGGISASANAYVLTRLGFTDVAVYASSLQEWAANSDNPMSVASGMDSDEP